MTITAFEQGKFYSYQPGPEEAVAIKADKVLLHGQPTKVLVAENKTTGDLWTITGTEDLTKWTEITQAQFEGFGG